MTALEQLEQWCAFREGDGFLTFHYTDCGRVTLFCGKQISVPADFIHDCGDPRHLTWDCGCPEQGWVGEFQTGAVGSGSSVPLDHGQHVWAFALTLDGVADALLAKVRAKDVCECHGPICDVLEQAEEARKELYREFGDTDDPA